jgi:hypothetical protein
VIEFGVSMKIGTSQISIRATMAVQNRIEKNVTHIMQGIVLILF